MAVPGDCGGWRDDVARYRWNVDDACRVLMCESRGDPTARNPSGATGLFQIKGGGSTDGLTNIAQAFAIWTDSGWRRWTCKP